MWNYYVDNDNYAALPDMEFRCRIAANLDKDVSVYSDRWYRDINGNIDAYDLYDDLREQYLTPLEIINKVGKLCDRLLNGEVVSDGELRNLKEECEGWHNEELDMNTY